MYNLFSTQLDEVQEQVLRSTDAYNLEWDNLSPEQQRSSRLEALKDYDKYNSWFTDEFTVGEIHDRKRAAERSGIAVVVLDCRWVDKVIVDEGEGRGVIKGKSRLTPRGFGDYGTDEDFSSPTAQVITHRITEILGLRKNWTKFKVDFKKAFFQTHEEIPAHKEVYIILPKDLQEGRRGDQRIARRLRKEVPGTKGAPASWYRTFRAIAEGDLDLEVSKVDSCLFRKFDSEGHVVLEFDLHVDDSGGRGEPKWVEWLEVELRRCFDIRYFHRVKLGEPCDVLGITWLEQEEGTYLSQQRYIDKKLFEIDISKKEAKQNISIEEGTKLYKLFRKSLGAGIWIQRTRPEIAYQISVLASKLSTLCAVDIVAINNVVWYLKQTKERALFLPRLPGDQPVSVIGITDAGLGSRPDGSSQGARLCGLTEGSFAFAPVEFVSKRVRRKGSSSFDVETLMFVETVDMALIIAILAEEHEHGVRPGFSKRLQLASAGIKYVRHPTRIVLDTDAKDLVTRVKSLKTSLDVSKRRRLDIADVQECLTEGDIHEIRHIRGPTNPVDIGTKNITQARESHKRYLQAVYAGTYIPDLTNVDDREMRVCRKRSLRILQELYDEL